MISARRVMLLGLLWAGGCGGIPIVSGDPFVVEVGPGADATAVAVSDLGRDAPDGWDAPDAPDAPDGWDAPDAVSMDQPVVEPIDATIDASRQEDSADDAVTLAEVSTLGDAAPDAVPCSECPAGSVGRVCCSAACRDLQTDKFNCGACGVVCPGADDCVAGLCRPSTCPTGTSRCGTACVNLQADPNHCGACGDACATGLVCSAGRCVCVDGRTSCGGVCVNTSLDGRHCGACDNACAPGFSCVTGGCRAAACSILTQTNCGGVCFDLLTSPAHCGACGTACAAGESCLAGRCACPTGQDRCGGPTCLPLSTTANCGACGNRCGTGQLCLASVCVGVDAGAPDGGFDGGLSVDVGLGFDAGTPDTVFCGADESVCSGLCVNTNTNRAHCGGCGQVCTAVQNCVAGTCLGAATDDVFRVCQTGTQLCDGECVDPLTRPDHCGGCGRVCASPRACVVGLGLGAEAGL
jgi:hypothetical protein